MECVHKMQEVTAIDELSRLISQHKVPTIVILDVKQRVEDWRSSISYRNDNDPYLWQQVLTSKKVIVMDLQNGTEMTGLSKIMKRAVSQAVW